MLKVTELLSPAECLEATKTLPLIDVRTPSEFIQGHIPGAVNLPVFSDEERGVVGTLYKKQGRDAAVLKGLEYVGPKMAEFVRVANSLAVNGQVLVHCWRGGMRSGSMAWLFRTAGLNASVLEGGYKAYRAHIRKQFQSVQWKFMILGGPTGSGKTDVLKSLEDTGQQVLDLEGLANHKGSAFGALGQEPQPTSEQFENNIYEKLRYFNPSKIIWVEGESHSIGRVFVPDILFELLMKSPLVMFELTREKRIERLVREYGSFSNELLAESVKKIQKRLGGLRTSEALKALENDDYRKVADITLEYYDKGYSKSLGMRNKPIFFLETDRDDPSSTAKKLANATIENI